VINEQQVSTTFYERQVIQMELVKLDHIHIYVKNIEKSIEFFEGSLGVKFGDIHWTEEVGIKDCYARPGLLLMQPTIPDSPEARLIERKGEGLAGISLRVRDLEAAVAELQSKGLRLMAKIQDGSVKEACFHPKDSFGVLIELCEYPGDDIGEAPVESPTIPFGQVTS